MCRCVCQCVKGVYSTLVCLTQNSITLTNIDVIYMTSNLFLRFVRRYHITNVIISWISFQQMWPLSNLFIKMHLGVHEYFFLKCFLKNILETMILMILDKVKIMLPLYKSNNFWRKTFYFHWGTKITNYIAANSPCLLTGHNQN